MALIKGEVRRWLADEVTQEMFDRIGYKIKTLDEDVHNRLLAGGDIAVSAIMPNAEMQSLKEVLIISQDLLEEAEGE